MKTYYAAFLRRGSRWDASRPVREQELWDEHAAFMDALVASGMVVLAGPFGDGSGSLVVCRARDAERVRAAFRDDPWAVHDILLVDDVKEWTVFLESRDG